MPPATLPWSAAVAFAAGLLAACAIPPRVARWNADLDMVRDRFLPADKSYTPATRHAAELRIEALRSRLPQIDDPRVMAELARIAALSGNAHTRAYLLRNRGLWRRYPLRIWRFDDGWRVVAAQREAEPLVGARIVAIASRPVDEVAAALRPLFAGNDSWAEYMASYTLTSPDALREVLALGAGDSVELTVELGGVRQSARIQPLPLVPRAVPEESWWFLSPAHPAARGWRRALAGQGLPPLLEGAATYYRELRCADGVVYAQFNRAADAPGQESIAAWGERLLGALRAQPARRLLLDLRFNTGGDLGKARPWIEALAQLPLAQQPGGVVVLSDIATFSAGITPMAWLRGHTRAIIVGRHPGDDPVFWAEGGNVVLPNSGVAMHYADGLHVYAARAAVGAVEPYLAFDGGAGGLAPDLSVPWTWADHLASRDPAAEAALGKPLVCQDS